MFKRNWGYIAAAGLIVAVVGLSAYWLLPDPPHFAKHSEIKRTQANYQPGGSSCKPDNLALLPEPSATGERDRCEAATEQYRLDTEDLKQQTRAADGAQIGAGIAHQGLVISLLGTFFSLLTLLTAIAAVWFAKRAADSAEQGVKLAIDTSQAELRAYLGTNSEIITFDDEKQRSGGVAVNITNRGSTPAHSATFRVHCYVQHQNGGVDETADYNVPMGTLAPGVPVDLKAPFKISGDNAKKLKASTAFYMIRVSAKYRDAFGGIWNYEHLMMVDKATLDTGTVTTLECKQNQEDPEAKQKLANQPQLPFWRRVAKKSK